MEAHLTWWPSPAKLNLFLHITGRNAQGYHLLQSVFQILDQGDELAFEANQSGQIRLLTEMPGVAEHDNLIVKAARRLQEKASTPMGCDIHIRKNLPMGGGIGGGSSNAATTLVALNHLWKLGLSEDELATLGLQLGADVPIFVRGHSAFAQGVGELLTPMHLDPAYYLVANPGCHVSTADIFAEPDLQRDCSPISVSDYQFEQTTNVCEKIVCQRYPQVAKLLHHLLEYAPSRMTGTGACVFAVFDTLDHAQRVQETLPDHCQSFIAKGVDRSPLFDVLSNNQR